MRHIVILGAGISGLSTAWFLKKRFGKEISLTIIDKSKRPGGWMQTSHTEGFLFEQGPHSCRATGAGLATLQLAEELGLQDHVVTADPASHIRYLYHNQSLQRLPTGPLSCLFSPLMKGIIPALIRDWRTPPGNQDDESIYDFFSRRFGPSIAERFADSLASGVFAGDIRQLSLKSCFPSLYRWEQDHGSVLRGAFRKNKSQATPSSFIQSVQKGSLFSFKGGMETLPKELARQIDAEILLGVFPTACAWDRKGITLRLSDRSVLHADHLFAAIPPAALASLMPPREESLIQQLKRLSYASVAVVSLGFKEKVLTKRGFGYLIPSQENEEILGVIWDSCVFPQQNQQPDETRLTVMIGGTRHPRIHELSKEECLDIALRSLDKHLQIKQTPAAMLVSLAHHAIPQYTLGHDLWATTLKQSLADFNPRLTLLGNAFGGAAINDCISNAKILALE